LVTALVAALSVVFLVSSSSGTLAGSTFSSNNGSLTPTAPATHDWNSPLQAIVCPASPGSGTNCGVDFVKPSTVDNALGQGTKEDATSVTVVQGSIPPNKDDLSRFYINQEKVGTTNFLYLAWERSNVLGSAHMDFEFNQSQVGITTSTTGGVTLNRTAGDVMITFDFGGSGAPVLGKLTWLTSGPGSACFVAKAPPCWGNFVDLTAAGDAEGQVNASDVTDSVGPGGSFDLPAGTFGEAGINLNAAGLFTNGQCTTFGDAWLKSRSSGSSFGSELKDFIAPIPVNISNCGTIIVKKVTVPAGQTDSFGYTATGGLSPTSFNLTGAAGSDTQTYTNVPAGGPYTVTEGSTTGYDLTGLVCTSANSTSTTSTSGATATVSNLAADDTVTCTYTNTKRGAIVVKKVTVPPTPIVVNGFPSTQFPFSPSGFGSGFNLTGGGSQTFTNLVPTTTSGGPYSVSETPPSGWTSDGGSCDNGTTAAIKVNPGATTTCTFTNTENLGAIQITKTSSKASATPIQGVTFDISTDAADSNKVGSVTTNASGIACLDTLPFATAGTTYYVTETSAPAGWSIDHKSAVAVVVNRNATCSSGTPNTTSFTDTPLTDLKVTATGEVSGQTKSTITCTNSAAANVGNSPQGPADPAEVDANGLKPGTYTCTVTIDP
jgi:hypothetical protein